MEYAHKKSVALFRLRWLFRGLGLPYTTQLQRVKPTPNGRSSVALLLVVQWKCPSFRTTRISLLRFSLFYDVHL